MADRNYQKMANDDIAASVGNYNVHDHLKDLSVEEIRAECDKDRLPWMACVLNVTGELNTGTIIRNALLCGAQRVLVLGRRRYDKRGTVGSENYIDVDRIDALMADGETIDKDVFWAKMKEYNADPIFVEQGGEMLSDFGWDVAIDDMNLTDMIPCLVFGNENRGVQQDILDDAEYIVSIPQLGVIRSFNVGSSSAIVMYDMIASGCLQNG